MRIIKVFKRVGNSSETYKFKATVDLQTDITKYSDTYINTGQYTSIEKRFKTGVFTIEQLERSVNYEVFKDELEMMCIRWRYEKMINLFKIQTNATGQNIRYIINNIIFYTKKMLHNITPKV